MLLSEESELVSKEKFEEQHMLDQICQNSSYTVIWGIHIIIIKDVVKNGVDLLKANRQFTLQENLP